MPSITITLSDTPTGGVSVHSDFKPAIGTPLSPAQSAALDIVARTSKQWGMPTGAAAQLAASQQAGDSALSMNSHKFDGSTIGLDLASKQDITDIKKFNAALQAGKPMRGRCG